MRSGKGGAAGGGIQPQLTQPLQAPVRAVGLTLRGEAMCDFKWRSGGSTCFNRNTGCWDENNYPETGVGAGRPGLQARVAEMGAVRSEWTLAES